VDKVRHGDVIAEFLSLTVPLQPASPSITLASPPGSPAQPVPIGKDGPARAGAGVSWPAAAAAAAGLDGTAAVDGSDLHAVRMSRSYSDPTVQRTPLDPGAGAVMRGVGLGSFAPDVAGEITAGADGAKVGLQTDQPGASSSGSAWNSGRAPPVDPRAEVDAANVPGVQLSRSSSKWKHQHPMPLQLDQTARTAGLSAFIKPEPTAGSATALKSSAGAGAATAVPLSAHNVTSASELPQQSIRHSVSPLFLDFLSRW